MGNIHNKKVKKLKKLKNVKSVSTTYITSAVNISQILQFYLELIYSLTIFD